MDLLNKIIVYLVLGLITILALIGKFVNKWIDDVSTMLKTSEKHETRITNVEANLLLHIQRSDARFDALEALGKKQLNVQRRSYKLLKSILGRRLEDHKKEEIDAPE